MISGQNITTFSCQKTNLDLVVGNVHFNVRTCFQLLNQRHFKVCACWDVTGIASVENREPGAVFIKRS